MTEELTFAEGIHLIVDILLKNQLICDLAQGNDDKEMLVSILDSLQKDVDVLRKRLELVEG